MAARPGSERVRIARIGKPFGVKGEVTVQVFTDDPAGRFAAGAVLRDGAGREVTLVSARNHAGRWVLSLAGVADRNAAEELRGTELFGDPAPATSAAPDEWYDHELVGLHCRTPDGAAIGVVTGVEHLPAQDLLVVRTSPGHEARVPFVTAIVRSVAADGIVIDPPGGLLEPDLEPPGPA